MIFFRDFRNPLPEMQKFQKELNDIFSNFSPVNYYESKRFPQINLWNKEDNLILTSELPGISPESINISVLDDVLTMQFERKPEDVKEEVVYHRCERNMGSFTRSIKLPFRVDPNKVSAEYSKGILNITMVQAAEDKPRKIQITTK